MQMGWHVSTDLQERKPNRLIPGPFLFSVKYTETYGISWTKLTWGQLQKTAQTVTCLALETGHEVSLLTTVTVALVSPIQQPLD